MNTVKIVAMIVVLMIAFLGIVSPMLFEFYYQHLDRKYHDIRPDE